MPITKGEGRKMIPKAHQNSDLIQN